MKVICNRDSLLEAINIAQKAVSTKSTLPILEGILIEAGDKLKLTGYDLEIGIECYIDADIQVKGSIVINSKILGDIIRKMSDIEVIIEVRENNFVIIESNDTHFKIKGLSPVGFPLISLVNTENTFTLSQGLIKEMIKKTIFAVSIDESMPILTGSLIECKDGKLTFVSMDKARMAVYRSTIKDLDIEFKVVVPGKTLNEIMKILRTTEEEVTIYCTNNQIVFKMQNCKVISPLIEGEYFNYNRMIFSDFETKIEISTERLLLSVERAFLLASGEKRYPIKFKISDERMVISCETDFGEVNDEIKTDITGSELSISFNPMLFLDTLRAIDDKNVMLLFATNRGPCAIRPINNDKFTYIIAGVLR